MGGERRRWFLAGLATVAIVGGLLVARHGGLPSSTSGQRATPVADRREDRPASSEPSARRADRVDYTVCLQPLGEHDASLLAPMARGIAQAYGFSVRRLPATRLPDAAWYPPRARYRADALLQHLLFHRLPESTGCHALLGVTGVDISTTKAPHFDWGVLGLAFFGQRVAVVSSHRLVGVARPRVVERMTKVAIHELGHVVGIGHRSDGPAFIMNDAVSAVATIDAAQGALCAPERDDAERFLGRALPARDALDWRAIIEGG